MPIRINLKELFPADAQEITVDKINFNFNKLLELGVGEPGPIGNTGGDGPAGPTGLTGPQGIRGNAWYVDTVTTPTSFPGQMVGDFYLNSNTLAVWQYIDASPTPIWHQLFNIATIIDNYLASTPSPFNRGLDIGSPPDTRFIMFGHRTDSANDNSQGGITPSASTNDVLFLTNFNESAITSVLPDSFYNSLLSIVVDQKTVGRNHMEMGVLYLDGSGNPVLTTVNETFKMRFERDSTSVHTAHLDHRYREVFSLDIPDGGITTNRYNGVFEFRSPKYFPSPAVSDRSTFVIGSRYGLDEYFTSGTHIADGILAFDRTHSAGGSLGIAGGFTIPNFPTINTGYVDNSTDQSYLVLDAVGNSKAIYLNDTTYQTGGNFVQLGNTTPRATSLITSTHAGYGTHGAATYGAATYGNTIYVIGGDSNLSGDLSTFSGDLNSYSIQDPNNPSSVISINLPYSPAYSGQPVGAGVSDIAISGKFGYIATNQSYAFSTPGTPVYFQVVEFDASTGLPVVVGSLGETDIYGDAYRPYDCLYRVKLKGNYAILITNALPHSSSPTQLGGSPDGIVYDGRILPIDITDPTNPIYAVNPSSPYYLWASVYPHKITGSSTSFMDLDISDDIAATLTWEQTLASTCAVKVYISIFDTSGLTQNPQSAIQFKTNSADLLSDTGVGVTLYNKLSKKGGIAVNRKNVYAAYSVYDGTHWTVTLSCNSLSEDLGTITQLASLSVSTNAIFTECTQIKQLGNSIYLCAHTANLSGLSSTVFKVDVSDPSNPTLIWSKSFLSIQIERFVIVGKHIYGVANQFATTTPVHSYPGGIVALDFDGIYTGGAHIESLRSDEITVMKNLSVGEHLTVHNDVNIGGGLNVTGGMSVSGEEFSIRTQTGTFTSNNNSGFTITAPSGGASTSLNIVSHGTGNSNITLYNESDEMLRLRSYPASNYSAIETGTGKALYIVPSDAIVHINSVLQLNGLASAPSSPSEGMIYYNSATKKAYCYNGTGWQALF